MTKLSFQDVINFYPSNNDAVYRDLKLAIEGGHLTPFIGAGLSVFCGYKLWPDVLRELCEFIPDEKPRAVAQRLIEENQYLEAAEHIHKCYSPMMRRLLGIVNYSKIDTCPDERLYSSAAWVLPKLFREKPLMTTNFDGVLEHVFSKQNCAFDRVVEPHDPNLLTQMRQKNTHSLFKLHGDIGRETTSMDRLVFTQSQYDNVYCEKGELISELKKWYQNQTLLFLGCSLAMDKTMEVLRDVASKDSGIRHFAIVGCKTTQRSELLGRFGELGIDAIFYNDDNHDAVRVVLENLLYETNQAAFQQLDEELYRFVSPVRRDDVLMYNAGRIKYVGRTEEMAALERFCASIPINEWWAITGPGGMGKSRLVYEFTNKKQKEGWQIRWFSRDQYSQLREFQLPSENTIVVLDDVQADIQIVGNWLKAIREHRRRNRLRVLLLERDGKNYASADWLRLLRSGSPYSDTLAKWCYSQTFLHMNPLEEDDLKHIMIDCAATFGKTVDADALLAALIRVDKKLRRPLYAIAVAEAACNGEDPIHWNSERVLDEMLDRELAFHYESLQYIIKDRPTESQQTEMENLMAHCCIQGHLRLQEITQARYPYLTAFMERMSNREFFRALGLLQTDKECEVLRMNCPDLIREHLVLRLALKQGRMNLLFPDDWQNDVSQISFLNHLVRNHMKQLESVLYVWEQILSAEPENVDACEEYADLLWSITACCDIYCADAVMRLERLFTANSTSSDIRTAYAAGIFNLSVDSDLEAKSSAKNKLSVLCRDYPDDRGIALGLAKSLRSLSYEQNAEDCSMSVKQLTVLCETYPGDREFALELAISLRNLMFKQNLKEGSDTFAYLSKISEEHPDDMAFLHEIARGLCYLAFKQDIEGRIETVNRLTKFSDEHPGDRTFAIELARGLRCLAFDQDIEGRVATVKQLTKLSEDYHRDKAFLLELARGLRCLAFKQNLEQCRETIKRLNELSEEHHENVEFAIELARGLRYISFDQDLEERKDTVKHLAELSEKYPDNRELALELAIGLRNLISIQDLECSVESIEGLAALRKTHSNDRDISLEMARGLRIRAYKQELEGCTETVNLLTCLSEEYPKDRDFSLQLAIALSYLSIWQDLGGRIETVKRLTELSDRFPADKAFAIYFANALRQLSYVQDPKDRVETVNKIIDLSQQYPEEREIALELAKALQMISYKQDVNICAFAIQQLADICGAFPGDEELADYMACSLVNFAFVQTTEKGVLDILVKSEEIQKAYPDCDNIQLSYAMTWFNLTLVQQEDAIDTTVTEIKSFLKSHTDIVPKFKEALNKYLNEHPGHVTRYQSLLEM